MGAIPKAGRKTTSMIAHRRRALLGRAGEQGDGGGSSGRVHYEHTVRELAHRRRLLGRGLHSSGPH